jgi:hypothetical protein
LASILGSSVREQARWLDQQVNFPRAHISSLAGWASTEKQKRPTMKVQLLPDYPNRLFVRD